MLLCNDQSLHDFLLRDDLLHDRALPPVEEVHAVGTAAASPRMMRSRTHQVMVVVMCCCAGSTTRELLCVIEIFFVCELG